MWTKKLTGVLLFGLLLTSTAQATLMDNGDGTITDDSTNLMWLQDANTNGAMNWVAANAWADSLVFAGYDDWRLPTALNQDGSGPCFGFNCSDSEMGNLYYGEGITTGSPGLFTNVQSLYWSGTEFDSDGAWYFDFSRGDQNINGKSGLLSGWAVRSGDVGAAVPAPATLLLMAAGLGLLGFARKQRRR